MISNTSALESLVQNAIAYSKAERPEVTWLKRKYKEFCLSTGMDRKADADMLIYERMYAVPPQKETSVTKIRFWRTGKHIPTNREQAKAFARALELNDDDIKYFFQAYMDRADVQFTDKDKEHEEYKKRLLIMDNLINDYLVKLHPSRRIELGISQNGIHNNLRHIYYTDAINYIDGSIDENKSFKKHITSVNYGSELLKNIRLMGETPRKTMIRHLFILGMPYISREVIDENLISLGYLPLSEEHTLQTGERLDYLIIKFLDIYKETCTGKAPEECNSWLKTKLVTLDKLLKDSNQDNMRFMYFKSIDLEDN